MFNRKILFFFLMVLLLSFTIPSVLCQDAKPAWDVSILDTIVYGIDPVHKKIDFQFYFSFDVNASFECRMSYFPTHRHVTSSFSVEKTSENWHSCKIDKRRENVSVSSNQCFLYPFEKYELKLLVLLNTSLQTEVFEKEKSKANFENQEDAKVYWNIKGNFKLLEHLPEEYSQLLDDAEGNIFYVQLELSRQEHQLLIPAVLFWAIPIALIVFYLLLILRRKKADLLNISPIGSLVPIFGLMQSQKPPCITIAEILMIASVALVFIFVYNSLHVKGPKIKIEYDSGNQNHLGVFSYQTLGIHRKFGRIVVVNDGETDALNVRGIAVIERTTNRVNLHWTDTRYNTPEPEPTNIPQKGGHRILDIVFSQPTNENALDEELVAQPDLRHPEERLPQAHLMGTINPELLDIQGYPAPNNEQLRQRYVDMYEAMPDGCYIAHNSALLAPRRYPQYYLSPGKYWLTVKINGDNMKEVSKRFLLTSPADWRDLHLEMENSKKGSRR